MKDKYWFCRNDLDKCTCKKRDDRSASTLTGLLSAMPWYRRWFPYLPIWYYNESLRVFTFQLWDCSVVHHSLTKLHRFDVLIKMHRKWWQPKYIGFSIWLCS